MTDPLALLLLLLIEPELSLLEEEAFRPDDAQSLLGRLAVGATRTQRKLSSRAAGL